MTDASRDLEILVAKIQKQLAPNSEVLHNVMLDGRISGRKRQIDVLVRQQIGQYEIQIVIDCKDYSRPVDVKGVEEFHGLLDDVGAQKGVLVCPNGFSSSAKKRAESWQIDLYSPIDTDAHKWQANPSIRAICDFRRAEISFGLRMKAPLPFKTTQNFFAENVAYNSDKHELGTMLDSVVDRWNEGKYPTEPGEHKNLPAFDALEVLVDNGYGTLAPVDLYITLYVSKQLYFGSFKITQISAFKDEISGGIIANAFTVGILSPDEVIENWKEISPAEETELLPAMKLTGLIGWVV